MYLSLDSLCVGRDHAVALVALGLALEADALVVRAAEHLQRLPVLRAESPLRLLRGLHHLVFNTEEKKNMHIRLKNGCRTISHM